MKKQAWPWTGSTEKEMGSMSPSGNPFTDISSDTSERYDMLSPVKHIHEGTMAESGSEGMRHSVHSDFSEMQDEELSALKDMMREMRGFLCPNMTVAASGPLGLKVSQAIFDKDLNIISFASKDSDIITRSGSYRHSGSPMFCRFSSKLDGFIVDVTSSSAEEAEISIGNISEQLLFNGIGVILARRGDLKSSLLRNSDLEVLSEHTGVFSKYLVKNNSLSKVAVARYYNEKAEESASFLCDIADTVERQVDGLQAYSRLKKKCGLIFSYKQARDVMFHMGSVSYPIDIIFIDSEDNIKKISKNIQPGSLEVFSCTGTLNVLEVSGGVSDLLNIKVGGKIYITSGEAYSEDLSKMGALLDDLSAKRVAFKRSKKGSPMVYSSPGATIIRVQGGLMPDPTSIIRKLGSKRTSKEKIAAIDADAFLSTLGDIRLFSSKRAGRDDRLYRGLFGETFAADKGSYVDIPAVTFFKKGMYEKLNKKYSYIVHDSMLKALSDDHKKIIRKLSSESLSEVVLVSRGQVDTRLLDIHLESLSEGLLGHKISLSSSSMRIPVSYGTQGVYEAAFERYGELELYSNIMIKEGGMPVSEKVKSGAREALKYIDRALRLCEEVGNNFDKNLEAYQKVDGNLEATKGSRGKYNESCKRNSRLTKRMLLNVKSCIQLLNSIKDISTTAEVISAVAEAAKVSSGSIKEVFDLLGVIDSEDFVQRLSESTEKSKASLEDTTLTLNRARDYINSDILGILVITE